MKVAGCNVIMDFYEVSGFFEIRFDYSIEDDSISIMNLFPSDMTYLFKLSFSIHLFLPLKHANFKKKYSKNTLKNNNLRPGPFINSN